MKIAIAGYGIEGESSYRYWSADPSNTISIADQKPIEKPIPSGVETIIGSDAFDRLHDFDVVIRTASLSPNRIKTNGKIWSATNEFFEKCPATIIGVTGSKGKGTTASLITNILREAGKKVWLLGNIGDPSLDALKQIKPEDVIVYELSSFQLWDLQKSPNIAVILFIEQEHLDVHTDMEEYVNAKANITKHQTSNDLLVFNKNNRYAAQIAESSVAQKIGYTDENSAHVDSEMFCYGEQKICSVNSLGIIGRFNYDNACAAIDAIWGITNDISAIGKGLASFKGLPHRLQLIREIDDVKYYDDSIATIPGAAIAALKAFDESKVIILGGSSKGSDFTELANELCRNDVKAILIGDEATKIAAACRVAGFLDFEIIDYKSMAEIVALAKDLSKPGGVVLLSPASASFGLFKNYADRGDQFKSAVEMLK